MYRLPTEITIKDKVFHIRERGDFRMVLDCFSALQDIEMPKEFRTTTALFIFYSDFDTIDQVLNCEDLEELTKEMFNFFVCNENTDNIKQNNSQLIDWDEDAQMISSAINKVAGKEIRAEEYIHWWTFMGYYNAVGEGLLSTVVSIRKKIADGKKLEKHEQEFKRENPQYFIRDFRSVEQREADEQFRKLWNQE